MPFVKFSDLLASDCSSDATRQEIDRLEYEAIREEYRRVGFTVKAEIEQQHRLGRMGSVKFLRSAKFFDHIDASAAIELETGKLLRRIQQNVVRAATSIALLKLVSNEDQRAEPPVIKFGSSSLNASPGALQRLSPHRPGAPSAPAA